MTDSLVSMSFKTLQIVNSSHCYPRLNRNNEDMSTSFAKHKRNACTFVVSNATGDDKIGVVSRRQFGPYLNHFKSWPY